MSATNIDNKMEKNVNNVNNLDKFSLQKHIETLEPTKQKFCIDLLDEVKTMLHSKYDIDSFRDDSRLLWCFLSQQLSINFPESVSTSNDSFKSKIYSSVESICKELFFTKLLYSFTNYPCLCLTQLPSKKHTIQSKLKWFPSLNQRIYEHIQSLVLPELQLECLVKAMKNSKMIDENFNIL